MNGTLIKNRENKTLFNRPNKWNGWLTNAIARYVVEREMGQNGRACVPRHVHGEEGRENVEWRGVLAAAEKDLQRPGIKSLYSRASTGKLGAQKVLPLPGTG